MASYFEGLGNLSIGTCEECPSCEGMIDGDTNFGVCEVCETRADLCVVHGLNERGEIVHCEICADCAAEEGLL